MFFEHVLCIYGVPDNIITDRGTQFTSRFWNPVCSHMSVNHRLSTAIHPQTDGQMERQNQTLEQYLRAFCNYEQDNGVELIPLVEFTYNNAVYASTRMTTVWAGYHRHPKMQFKTPKGTSLKSETQLDVLLH
jgi:transposase InsO family protein